MNAQLEILAAMATTYFPKTETSGEYWMFDKEKFAELIVRECAGIAHSSDMPSKDIKEHFGVE